MLLVALGLLLACLLALLCLNDFKTRSRMQLAERIPGPKALPVLGNLLDFGLRPDSKLHVFAFLSVMNTKEQHYDILI
jgi:hypothetical protein